MFGHPKIEIIEILEHDPEVIRLLKIAINELRAILREVTPRRLTTIQLIFKGDSMPTPGPVTLTTAGQTATAVVVGFDQFGNPWTGAIPTVSWTVDNTAIVTQADNGDGTDVVTAVANGTANLTASLTTVEGLALTDTEQVIVNIAVVPPPTPVLSVIKVQFQ